MTGHLFEAAGGTESIITFKLYINREDEIGKLATSFTNMAKQLENLMK